MKKIDEGLLRKYLDRELFKGPHYRGEEEYLRKVTAWVVELTDGTLFAIRKPEIETRFCFGESGYDYDEANHRAAEARTNEDLFRIRNLRYLDEKIKILRDGPEPGMHIWVSPVGGVAIFLNDGRDWQIEAVNGPVLELDEENRRRLLEGYEIVRERFAKRIETYLKRYGLSKVRTWTYWMDA